MQKKAVQTVQQIVDELIDAAFATKGRSQTIPLSTKKPSATPEAGTVTKTHTEPKHDHGKEGVPMLGGARLTSPYGTRMDPHGSGELKHHNGVDLGFALNTPVLAPDDGVVTVTATNKLNGNYMVIDHGNFTTQYAHLNEFLVRPQQRVTKGQRVALSGNTGSSTAPHLHFILFDKKTKKKIDPSDYLKDKRLKG